MIDQELEEDTQVVPTKYLLNSEEDRAVDPETQARLEALLQAAGMQNTWNWHKKIVQLILKLFDDYIFLN